MSNTTNKKGALFSVLRYWYVFVCIGIICSIFLSHARADQTTSVIVPPRNPDFQFDFSSNDTNTHYSEGDVRSYTFTYGAKRSAGLTTTTTLVVNYSNDLVNGVHIFDYDMGSASNAYNNNPPVIDPVNRTITWTIQNLPPDVTDQIVTFKLKATANYSQNTPVTTKVTASMKNIYIDFPDITVQEIYSYTTPTVTPSPQSTPTPTPILTPTPTQKPSTTPTSPVTLTTLTPTPTPTTTVPTFLNIGIQNLTSTTADIGYIVTKKGSVSLSYGNSPSALTHTLPAQTNASGTFTLSDLSAQQTYYFQLTFSSSSESKSSDMFVLTTPPVSQVAEVVKSSVVIASDNDILYSQNLQNNTTNSQGVTKTANSTPTVAIAPTSNYNIAFKITKTQDIKTIQVLLQSTNVLGLADPAFAQSLEDYPSLFPAVDNGNGVFTANISNTLPPGSYSMSLVITDTKGNITTQQVATLHVLHPFQVFNSITKKPIENVRILLRREENKTYITLAGNGIQNPLFTNDQGIAEEQLLTGTYQATFTNIGYAAVIKKFSIGTSPTDDYPRVYLVPQPITPLRVFMYYKNTFIDYLALNNSYIAALHRSYRFFDLFGLLAIICSIILCFLIFSIKTNIPIFHLFWYIHHHSLLLVGKNSNFYIHGNVQEKSTKQPLTDAKVFLLSSTKQLIRQTTTNKAGAFLLPKSTNGSYFLTIMKEGYVTSEIAYSPDMVIQLEKNVDLLNPEKLVIALFKDIFSLGFEFMLVFSLLLELILFPAFGLTKTIPFISLSCINVFLWFLYLRESRKRVF